LVKLATENGIKLDEDAYTFSKNEIKNRMKAYIGHGLFDNEAFYPLLLSKDKTFLRALQEFN
ncbi:MAG: hypothetical protein KAH25_10090, partial [Bacteroidales bacterium]|nr:hypothetical protein [Bacteroidales bacterium]